MKKRFMVLFFALSLIVISGCYPRTQLQQRPQDQGNQTERLEQTFTLYYGDKEILELITERRTVTVTASANPLQVAVEELTKEPITPDAVVLMPPQTKVHSVIVVDGIITIDFNEKLHENFNGGSSSEALLVDSIVNTVTEFKGYADHKVAFLINGQSFETIGGHISAEDLFKRQP